MVSSKQSFMELIKKWGHDPCLGVYRVIVQRPGNILMVEELYRYIYWEMILKLFLHSYPGTEKQLTSCYISTISIQLLYVWNGKIKLRG